MIFGVFTGYTSVACASDALFDFVLVDVDEDVRRAEEYSDRAADRHRQEYVQQEPVHHHGNVAPVF